MSLAREHWDRVYRDRPSEESSWFQAYPGWSLTLIEATGAAPDAPLIDVGCGDSRLLDALLVRGYSKLTGLDVSSEALARARLRLGARAARVTWCHADISRFTPPQRYRVWHDRAVFHFLGSDAERRQYLDVLARGLAPGGHLVMATFAVDGPRQCSGLPVRGYDAATLGATLGPGYELLDMAREVHRTPAGQAQAFAWFRFRRTG